MILWSVLLERGSYKITNIQGSPAKIRSTNVDCIFTLAPPPCLLNRFCGYDPEDVEPIPVEPSYSKGLLLAMASDTLGDSFSFDAGPFDTSKLAPKTRTLESLELADVVKAVHKAFIG